MGSKEQTFEFIGHTLQKVIIWLLFLILIFQAIIYYKPENLQISLVDKLEGEPLIYNEIYPVGELSLEVKHVSLKIMNKYITSLPQAKVFRNGKLVSDFTNLQCTVLVDPGDYLIVDASQYSLDLVINIIPSEGIRVSNNLVEVEKRGKLTIYIENEG